MQITPILVQLLSHAFGLPFHSFGAPTIRPHYPCIWQLRALQYLAEDLQEEALYEWQCRSVVGLRVLACQCMCARLHSRGGALPEGGSVQVFVQVGQWGAGVLSSMSVCGGRVFSGGGGGVAELASPIHIHIRARTHDCIMQARK